MDVRSTRRKECARARRRANRERKSRGNGGAAVTQALLESGTWLAPRPCMTGNQRRVLVVEDDDGARWALTELLRLEGFVVAEARHGLEAVTVADTFDPDVIVSDVDMPEMGGVALGRWVQQSQAAPALVLMSARPPPCPEVGAFVSKPILLETLLGAIEAALASAARPKGSNGSTH